MSPKTEDIKAEIAEIKKATEKIRKDKKAALAYLIKHGFITPDGKLAEQYK